MAESRTLELILRLKDEASKQLQGFAGQVDKLEPAFKLMAGAGVASFAALSGVIYTSISAASENETAFKRMEQIMKTSTQATDEQVAALARQAAALEKTGVIGEEAILQAQGQLASFDLQAESIEKLIPSMLNYAAAEKGVGASTEDLQGVTNGLAQALQGNFGALTKVGFVLDEETKGLIANGTEKERVVALTEVLDSTYAGLNERLRDTVEGRMFALQNAMGDIQKTVGKALIPVLLQLTDAIIPIINKIAAWMEKHPELTKWILIVSTAVAGLVAGIGLLGLAIPAIIAGATALAGVFGVISLPVLAVVAVIAALTAGLVWLYKNVDLVVAKMKPLIDAFNTVKNFGSSVISKVGGFFGGLIPFAEGGIVTGPTPALVGEAGPEAIIPLSKMGSLGSNVTVNVYGDVSGQELVDTVQRALMQRLGSNTRFSMT